MEKKKKLTVISERNGQFNKNLFFTSWGDSPETLEITQYYEIDGDIEDLPAREVKLNRQELRQLAAFIKNT